MELKVAPKPFYARAYLYLGFALLVILVGFMPSYVARFPNLGIGHHFHGLTALLWMLLLTVQPFLYRMDKMAAHRALGKTSFALVPMLVLGGLYIVHRMMVNMGNYPPDLPYQLAFIDFFVLTQFTLFYGLAIKNVRFTELHARYMVCTVFGPLIPALTRALLRLPTVGGFDMALNLSYVLVEIPILLLLLDDRRQGKVRLPYVLALVLMVAQHVLMNFASGWGWWRSFMDFYASLPL